MLFLGHFSYAQFACQSELLRYLCQVWCFRLQRNALYRVLRKSPLIAQTHSTRSLKKKNNKIFCVLFVRQTRFSLTSHSLTTEDPSTQNSTNSHFYLRLLSDVEMEMIITDGLIIIITML